MIDIFLEPRESGAYEISDYGQTLMRLSYSYELDTPKKIQIFNKIILENKVESDGGTIKLISDSNSLFRDVMQLSQALLKVGSMRFFKREVIESLFFEMLEDFVFSELLEFKPRKNVLPISERDDLEVDYMFQPNGHQIFLYGVKDPMRARLATISCLEFQKAKINFRSVVVHEDLLKLPKKDISRLTNACDKQFTSLDEFKNNARAFLERERSQ